MEPLKFTDSFRQLLEVALRARHDMNADALLLLVEGPVDWGRLRKYCGDTKIIIAVTNPSFLQGADQYLFHTVMVDRSEAMSINDCLTHAILESVAKEFLQPGTKVVTLYSGFDPSQFDSISIINLGEHLDRLSGKDLRLLQTKVPLRTLKLVVDLALEIGREGREGKAVGTLFVVGDSRNVLAQSKPAGFDPVKGYHRKERCLSDPKVREGIKEVSQLDGAFVIAADGTVEAACRYLETNTAMITVSKGLGARHWAAAAISRTTNAVVVAVSQSGGTVRIFHNGEVFLRIESQQARPMVWRNVDDYLEKFR